MARKIRKFNQGSELSKEPWEPSKKQVESFTKREIFDSLSSIGIPLIFWFRRRAIAIVSIINWTRINTARSDTPEISLYPYLSIDSVKKNII